MTDEPVYPGDGPTEEDFRLPEIALNSLDDAVLVCQIDAPHTITFSNAALSRIRGSRRRLTNAPFPRSHSPFPIPSEGPSFTRLFVAPPEKKTWESVMAELRGSARPVVHRLVLRPGDRADPNPVPVDVRMTPVLTQDGKITQFIAVLRDIRPQLYAEKERAAIAKNLDCVIAELSNRALHDNMTGLPNRFYFKQKIDGNLTAADRRRKCVGFILIDLDNFKEVNDTLGHSAGDALLMRVVESLRRMSLPGEYIVRWGGDEFLWVVPDLENAAALETRFPAIIEAVAAVGRPDPSISGVTASIGFSVYPNDGTSVEDLVSMADYSMYRAKGSGKNGWCKPGEGSAGRPGHNVAPSAIFRKIATALDSGGIGARYSPVVRLDNGRIVALECRMSWVDPELGEIPAEEFIPYVERKGQFAAFAYAMLDKSLAEFAPVLRDRPGFRIVFDLSLPLINDRNLPAHLDGICAAHGVRHGSITLRVVERKAFLHRPGVKERFAFLKDAGYRFALAHYASGEMSNQTFLNLAFDELQIDEIVVRQVGSVRGDWVLNGVINLCRSTQVELVPCGVDSDAMRDALLALGYEYGKGAFAGTRLSSDEVRVHPGFKK